MKTYGFDRTFLTFAVNLLVLVCLSLFVTLLFADDLDYGKIKTFGCEIKQTKDFNFRWQFHAWASYEETEHPKAHDWEALSSVRESRKAAMKDCDRWIAHIQKKIKERHGSKTRRSPRKDKD